MTFFLPFTERNLILTGYIGPDQPQIGVRIAERLRMPYINVDVEIAKRVSLPVEEMRVYYGETHLKTVEAEIIRETVLRRSSVIRVNGRSLLHSDYFHRLQSTGPVICLVVELGEMLRRLHMTMGARYHDPQERALALAELQREWMVRELEGIHEIDATSMTHDDLIDAIIALWQSLTIRAV